MDCTQCGKAIKRGERYVAVDLHVERQGRFSVKVEEADLLAAYHVGCAPAKIAITG